MSTVNTTKKGIVDDKELRDKIISAYEQDIKLARTKLTRKYADLWLRNVIRNISFEQQEIDNKIGRNLTFYTRLMNDYLNEKLGK